MLGRAKLAETAAGLQSQLARLAAEVRYIQQDGDKLVKEWRKGERYDIPIRGDDPLRRAADSPRRPLPLVVFSGRQVGYLYMKEINFWDKLADLYWQNMKEPRPEATRLYQKTDNAGTPATAAVTPDTPDRPGAP